MDKHHGHGKALAQIDRPVETTPEIPTGNRRDRDGIDNRSVEIGRVGVMLQRHDKVEIDNRLVVIDPATVDRSSDQRDNHATGALTARETLSNTPAPLAR